MIDFSIITTRGGDGGQTSIADGSRRTKDDLLIETIGDVDEFHAALGLAKAVVSNEQDADELNWIEEMLLRIGGMLAVPPSHSSSAGIPRVTGAEIEKLEIWQQDTMNKTALPTAFITYGSSEVGARLDFARAVCRRTERHLVNLISERHMNDLADAQRFMNRLSDYLFVKARQQDC